jgi:hypothetical protein
MIFCYNSLLSKTSCIPDPNILYSLSFLGNVKNLLRPDNNISILIWLKITYEAQLVMIFYIKAKNKTKNDFFDSVVYVPVYPSSLVVDYANNFIAIKCT